MNPDSPVILDTCVLVPVSLCDTLLRLAECGLYVPRWSSETRVELERALVTKIGLTAEKASKRVARMHEYFGDAVVHDGRNLRGVLHGLPLARDLVAEFPVEPGRGSSGV